MPKPLIDVATFNARYFAGRVAAGGPRYTELVRSINKYQTAMSAGGKNYASVNKTLQKIIYYSAEILTASKQPPGSSKRQVVQEVAEQAANELKYVGRRMHMGLPLSQSATEVKREHKSGVGAHYKEGLNRLSRGDWTKKETHENNYWLEYYDPLHRPGFLLHRWWVRWLKDPASCYAMSFFNWLAIQGAATSNAVNKTEQDLNALSATNRPLNVEYLNSFERLQYVKRPAYGMLFDVNDNPYDTSLERTHFSGGGWAIFVMDQKSKLYAGSHIVGVFHHSSFLGGKPTKAAGELLVTNGKLSVVTGKSGHYLPDTTEMKAVLDALVEESVVAQDAVCKPSFGDPNWYNAIAWRANPGGAPPLNRAAVLKKIPVGARGPKVMASLPAV